MNEYELQLLAVQQAIEATKDEIALQELLALKENLIELIALTQIDAEETTKNNNGDDHSDGNNDADDEMAKFMKEISEMDNRNISDKKKLQLETLKELRSKYEAMVGEKCSAPHEHSWGSISYHNAIICGIEDTTFADEDDNLDVRLRVLFTNPTHKEMVPCSYYLEGDCRFDDENCHFSHGESVPAADIKEYVVPDFSRLSRNCEVLAKMKDRLWHRGRVLCANFVEKTCRVRLDGRDKKERESDFNFEDLYPIHHENDSSSDSSSEFESEDDSTVPANFNLNVENIFTYQLTQPLGDWEKHTRGIGSKLMAQMGYVYGSGLGSSGRGIVTPVSAQILPAGRSLDHCMELREAANGDKDLFSVEKRLKKDQKKQEILNAKSYERETNKNQDVFSFLNENILSSSNKVAELTTESNNKLKASKPALHNHSSKTLNVESVRISDDIRRKEREIAEVEKSLKRNVSSGSKINDHLKQKLSSKHDELYALQRAEKSLNREQATRKTKEKLSVF